MSVVESILYGLISGLAEFLPISSHGHQAILMHLFGQDHRDPIRDILIHIAMLLALLTACRSLFVHLRREHILTKRRRRTKHTYDRSGIYELRLVKTATIPMLLGMLLYITTRKYEFNLIPLALFFAVNGILIIITEYLAHGNKNAKAMTSLDAVILGIGSLLSAFPGISRVGVMSSFLTARGADRRSALNWIFALSMPALGMYVVFDIIYLISQGADPVNFTVVLGYMLSAISAFGGGYLGISLLRYLTVQIGYGAFAFYSWGAGLFSFILYLIV